MSQKSMMRAEARVPTPKGERYAKQLCNHAAWKAPRAEFKLLINVLATIVLLIYTVCLNRRGRRAHGDDRRDAREAGPAHTVDRSEVRSASLR